MNEKDFKASQAEAEKKKFIVNKGDDIGGVGSTGTSTGNQLHLEIRNSDSKNWHATIDPKPELEKIFK